LNQTSHVPIAQINPQEIVIASSKAPLRNVKSPRACRSIPKTAASGIANAAVAVTTWAVFELSHQCMDLSKGALFGDISGLKAGVSNLPQLAQEC